MSSTIEVGDEVLVCCTGCVAHRRLRYVCMQHLDGGVFRVLRADLFSPYKIRLDAGDTGYNPGTCDCPPEQLRSLRLAPVRYADMPAHIPYYGFRDDF